MIKELNAAIITIGDELLIGQTIDTNSAYIATELNKIGIWIKRRVSIGDVKEEILNALKEQSRDCQVIIITGGLGPTSDDITKPVLCDYFQSELIVNEEALQNVINIFNRLGRPLIERNLKQAEVPDNCTVLPNLRGTAPGMWFEKEKVIYVSLPGVPYEMKGLMQNSVLPRLKEQLQLPAVVHFTLLTGGKGESEIAEILIGFEGSLPPYVKLAYLPAYGLLRLRLTGRSEKETAIRKELQVYFDTLKEEVKEWLVSEEDITIEESVSRLLKTGKKTVSTAESCTGGYIAQLITSQPGSSAIYNGSVISYANQVKMDLLGVQKSTLQQYGAVSEQTVKEMVSGVLHQLKTDYAIATSGIMGPDGGTPEKPVGMVWIAVGNKQKILSKKYQFRFDRSRNIEQTAKTALLMLYRYLIEEQL
jgi:nicotinamide-nucleotide amidase